MLARLYEPAQIAGARSKTFPMDPAPPPAAPKGPLVLRRPCPEKLFAIVLLATMEAIVAKTVAVKKYVARLSKDKRWSAL